MTPALRDAGTLRREDAEARRFAQTEFVRPVVLEAGAGTGKTATLVARVLAWALGPGWERAATALSAASGEPPDASSDAVAARVFEGLVAITFTEAAAAEMAERIERELDRVAQGQLPPTLGELAAVVPEARRTERAAVLRGRVDRLVVQTIHAWCRSLLRAFPLEAGLHPGFEVDADGSLHREQIREVLDERLRRAYDGPPGEPAVLELAAEGLGPGELEEALLALVEAGVGPDELAVDPLASERVALAIAELAGRTRTLLDAGAGGLADCERSPRGQRTAEALLVTGARLEAAAGASDLDALCQELRELWGEKDQKRLRDWGQGRLAAAEREVLADGGAAMCEAARSLWPALRGFLTCEPRVLAPLHALLHELLSAVDARMQARGALTFQGLLDACARLLGERRDVAAQVRSRVDQLLVDEFQDTDARQCAIVAALALEGDVATRPGLFLVGDPKQSIYGWRSADLVAYEAFLERVAGAGGCLRRLSVNHRSVPAVLDEVDRVMPAVMQARAGLQPGFERLVASPGHVDRPGFGHGHHAPVEHWLPIAPGDDALRQTSLGEATRLEAQALAQDLRRLHDECGLPWEAVGVLFRSRGDWDVYLAALREAGVPFSVEGDRSYYRRREIVDAAALVRCVLDPEDRLALAAALRCSAVGVPDAALEPLFASGLAEKAAALPDAAAQEALERLVDGVAGGLPRDIPGIERIEGWQWSFVHFARVLGELREVFAREPGDRFVEALRRLTLFEVGEAGRFLGSWRAANLERFFCELADWLGAGMPPAEVLRRLRHAVAEEEPREEGRPRDLLPDAVSILTLHGAKGLDFGHVYLMQLQKGGGTREDDVVARRTAAGVELRVHGVETLGFSLARERDAEVAAHERVRLLYVGMTRARERLVLSWLPGAYRRGGDDTLAQLLARREPGPPDPEALDARCRAEGGDRVAASDVLWVLPAHGQPVLAPPRPARRRVEVDVPEVERQARRLERAGGAARERMARPLGGRASEADGSREEASEAPGAGVEPERARAVGSALHAVLEHLDPSLPPDAALARAQEHLDVATDALPPRSRAEVRDEARRLLEFLGGGVLLARLHALDGAIVARELPLLVAPEPGEEALGFVTGAIDLLYRDPGDGALVVVDYKTDRVADGTDSGLARRAREHARQGAVYQRAVQDALALDAPPRFEVWFLAHDRAVAIESAACERAPGELALGEPLQLGLAFDAP